MLFSQEMFHIIPVLYLVCYVTEPYNITTQSIKEQEHTWNYDIMNFRWAVTGISLVFIIQVSLHKGYTILILGGVWSVE